MLSEYASSEGNLLYMGENFRIIPELRISRLTFFGKSASKCLIREIIIASLIYFKSFLRPFILEIENI